MTTYNLTVSNSVLGEGPTWDEDLQCLWWVDIEQGEVHKYTLSDGKQKTISVGRLCSAIVPCTSGKLLLALKDGLAYMDKNTGCINHLIQIETDLPDNRLNDGKCDPEGRFWVGSMDYKKGLPGAGSLYTLETDLSVSSKIPGVSCSNGLAWNFDHTLMYYIDSPTREVVSYQYEKATGRIYNKTTVVRIPVSLGMPDGMTIDRDGMLWVALWGGFGVARYDPASGKCIAKITLPVANVTSCTFGGHNLDHLYITTARAGLRDDELKSQPLAGCVFVCENTGTAGFSAVRFFG